MPWTSTRTPSRSRPSLNSTLARMPWKTPIAVAGAVLPLPPLATLLQKTCSQCSAIVSMSRSEVFMSGAVA